MQFYDRKEELELLAQTRESAISLDFNSCLITYDNQLATYFVTLRSF